MPRIRSTLALDALTAGGWSIVTLPRSPSSGYAEGSFTLPERQNTPISLGFSGCLTNTTLTWETHRGMSVNCP
jgi:hypothetical protein